MKFLRQKSIWFFFILIVVGALVFEEIVDDVFYDPREGDFETPQFDNAVLSFMKRFRTPERIQVMIDVTALGSFSVLTLFVLLIAGLLIDLKNRAGLIYLTLSSMGAGLIPYFLKSLFGRERPSAVERLAEVSSFSFPSGHSFAASALYLTFAFLLAQRTSQWKKKCVVYCAAGAIVFLIGFSRIFLSVHFPSDVVGGIAGGIIWFSAVSLGYKIIHSR